MKPIASFFFLISLVVCLGSLPHPIIGSSLAEQVCERSHDKANCMAWFGLDPESEQANLQQLGMIALRLASGNATDTALYIKRMLNDTSGLDPSTEQALTDCAQHYVDANQQLDDSVAALLANAQHDVNAWVGAAIADAESCEDGFKESGSQDFLLTARNAIFKQLCNNALAINKLLTAN
ncbi:hypothetical protein P3X46_015107 [Hevea brasiliensis]|uniref:Pectinesterase inhibitor domain-containing protein n=1 Tax=Hevea brasiliensis TaxID=3981 RepID=A0ABQ9LWU8_HEVBR|nr:putative invertase inhibitor [Hevea brasiliensis]KAJ9171793.1 hypothetical protein P3X46_015107 [Hevea brasiliensis]